MCIRDRHHSAVDAADSVFAEEIVVLERCHQQLKPALYRTCLLYTSDAADERSSVDLGGRRIIKKKKHSQTCSLL